MARAARFGTGDATAQSEPNKEPREPKGKKRKLDDEGDSADEAVEGNDPPMPRHRVTTKGNNVPEHVESFEALRDRYTISSLLMHNLAQSGYKRPTGIQSYGVPILMEVRSLSVTLARGEGRSSRPC